MIVCNSTISGFKTIVGTISIHLAMAIAMFWVPKFDNSDFNSLNSLWNKCFSLHILLFTACLLNIIPADVPKMASQLFSTGGVIFYIIVYLSIAHDLTSNWGVYGSLDYSQHPDAAIAINWYFIELFMLFGIILAIVVLLMVRYFCHLIVAMS